MGSKKGKAEEKRGPATIQNRKASHDFEFVDTYEAGLVLAGSEVKSLFLGRANLTDAHCRVVNGELWVFNLDIEPYSHAAHFQPDRRRDRKLLMHRREIDTIERKAQEKGLAIIPYKVYFSKGKAKLGLALARGKRQYDKRDAIKDRETRREREREGL